MVQNGDADDGKDTERTVPDGKHTISDDGMETDRAKECATGYSAENFNAIESRTRRGATKRGGT